MRTLETKSTVGRTIIEAINRAPRTLRIIPLTIAERLASGSGGT